jgi:plastocyanin
VLRTLAFRLTLATVFVGAVVALPIVSGAASTEHHVKVKDFQFGDDVTDGNILTIEAGDKVVWLVDNGTHRIAPDDPAFFPESPDLNAGEGYGPITFDTPDEYPYHCAIHPQMTGVIKVAAPPTTTTSSSTTTTTAPPTTTTTKPPTTTTTTHPTTTTTAPATTTTTAPPGTTTTNPPPLVAGGTTTPTAPPGPAPTTTTGKSPDKPGKSGATTTTAKQGKGVDTATPEPPADPGGEELTVEAFGFDLPTLGTESPPAETPETPGDEQAAPITEKDKAPDRHGMGLLLGTGALVSLLGLGALGYKWRTRDSQYWSA